MEKITSDPIASKALINSVVDKKAGALITFSGVVRDNSGGRGGVLKMEYEANVEMAEQMIKEIEEEVMNKFPITAIAMQHRIGTVELTEPSVFIAVSAPHRVEAFKASEYAINTLKAKVPIWKKEFFEDGVEWVEGTPVKSG